MSYQVPSFIGSLPLTRLRVVGDYDGRFYLLNPVAGPYYVPNYSPGVNDILVPKNFVRVLDDDEVVAPNTVLGVVMDRATGDLLGGYYVVLTERIGSAPYYSDLGYLEQSEHRVVSSNYYSLPNGSRVVVFDGGAMHIRDNFYMVNAYGYNNRYSHAIPDDANRFLGSGYIGRIA